MANQYKPKLSPTDIHQIQFLISERERLLDEADKLTFRKIAAKFEISHQMVSAIACGKYHKHLFAGKK